MSGYFQVVDLRKENTCPHPQTGSGTGTIFRTYVLATLSQNKMTKHFKNLSNLRLIITFIKQRKRNTR